MSTAKPQPVTMLMLTPEQLKEIVRDAVASAVNDRDDEVLTLRQVADLKQVSTKTLKRQIARGEQKTLPGKPIRIMRSQIGKGS